MTTGLALLDVHAGTGTAPPPDSGWTRVATADNVGDVEREDTEIWALVTSLWDTDDTPEEGHIRKLP